MFPAGRFIHKGGKRSQTVGALLFLAVSAVGKLFLNGEKKRARERDREKIGVPKVEEAHGNNTIRS